MIFDDFVRAAGKKDMILAFQEMRHLNVLLKDLPPEEKKDNLVFFVIPGLSSKDNTTEITRRYLQTKGYKSFASGIEGGIEFTSACIDKLTANVQAARESLMPHQKLVVMGHSAGGLIARGIVKRNPDRVAAVFNLGSILKKSDKAEFAGAINIADAISHYAKGMTREDMVHFLGDLETAGSTPTVSIYSKDDTFLPSDFSISRDARVKHVRIDDSPALQNRGPSHMGLIYSQTALDTVMKMARAFG